MLLLWIGLAIAGGGAATVFFGIPVLETPFGISLLVGGLILIFFGLLIWTLGYVIRKFGHGQSGGGLGHTGMRAAASHVSSPLHARPGETNSSERRRWP